MHIKVIQRCLETIWFGSVICAVKSVSIYGSPRRCGGQGDILSGRQVIFLH